jgi:hypothetical protein
MRKNRRYSYYLKINKLEEKKKKEKKKEEKKRKKK